MRDTALKKKHELLKPVGFSLISLKSPLNNYLRTPAYSSPDQITPYYHRVVFFGPLSGGVGGSDSRRRRIYSTSLNNFLRALTSSCEFLRTSDPVKSYLYSGLLPPDR
jgi:hypothetical protein